MLIPFDFAVTQLRYLREALIHIAAFRPDGQTPASLAALIASTVAPRTAYIDSTTALDGGRADRRLAVKALHAACVDFTAQAVVTFRANPEVRERVERLPVRDQNIQDTLARADATLALWALLPQVGSPPAPFVVMKKTETLDQAAMQALRDAAGTAHQEMTTLDQAFQEAAAALSAKQREMNEVIWVSLALGKSQFDADAPERGIIDAIPADKPRGLPGKASIAEIISPRPGVVRLSYDADGATSFEIWSRAPGAEEFSLVVDDTLDKTTEITGLAPGHHEFYIRGRNSRGLGAESETAGGDVQG